MLQEHFLSLGNTLTECGRDQGNTDEHDRPEVIVDGPDIRSKEHVADDQSRREQHGNDYAFIPEAWLPRLRGVSVGSKPDWIDSGLSDHVPLAVDLADR